MTKILLTILCSFSLVACAGNAEGGIFKKKKGRAANDSIMALVVESTDGNRGDCVPCPDNQFFSRIISEAPDSLDAAGLMVHFARIMEGSPYVAHTLDKPGKEVLYVSYSNLDCMTFVETVMAMTMARLQMNPDEMDDMNFRRFCHSLARIRYRGGWPISFENRLHYFTQWTEDAERKGILDDVSTDKAPFTAQQTVSLSYMSKHPQSYLQLKNDPSLIPTIAKYEQEECGKKFRYIPKAQLSDTKALRQAVHDGDVIGLLASSPEGLDNHHLGIAVWHADGLHIIHASSIAHKVIEDPQTLQKYLSTRPKHPGIRVLRMK